MIPLYSWRMMELTGISASPASRGEKRFCSWKTGPPSPVTILPAPRSTQSTRGSSPRWKGASAEVKELVSDRDGALFEAQLLMFEDPELKDRVRALLAESKRNVEWVFLQIVEEMSRQARRSGQPVPA